VDTPKGKALGYSIVSVLVSTLAFFLMGAIAGAIFALIRIASGIS